MVTRPEDPGASGTKVTVIVQVAPTLTEPMQSSVSVKLPVATMLGLLVVAPGYLQGMAADSDGKKMIAGAIIAQVLGNFFIKKIIKIKV